jgi:hypothetical protein
MAGKPVALLVYRAFNKEFSSNVDPVSSTSIKSGN